MAATGRGGAGHGHRRRAADRGTRGCLGPGRRRGTVRSRPARGRARSARLRRALRCCGLLVQTGDLVGSRVRPHLEQVAAYSAEGSASSPCSAGRRPFWFFPGRRGAARAGSAPCGGARAALGSAGRSSRPGGIAARTSTNELPRQLQELRRRRASARTARLRARPSSALELEVRDQPVESARPSIRSRDAAYSGTSAHSRARPGETRGGTGRRTRCAP